MKTYRINEIFYSVQGEGVRAGTANHFIRFSKCNQKCTVATHGFDCDTEYESGVLMALPEILSVLHRQSSGCRWVILTGGEPGLQVDTELITALHERHFKLAIETNGSVALPAGLDWVCVSPKFAEHTLKQLTADEVKYVRHAGQGIPETVVSAAHYLLSPAFGPEGVIPANVAHCLQLCKEHPQWRLSMQLHRLWQVR